MAGAGFSVGWMSREGRRLNTCTNASRPVLMFGLC